MEKSQLCAALTTIVPEAVTVEGKQFAELTVAPQNLRSVIGRLKEDPGLSFDILVCLTGMDYGTDLGVVYHLRSYALNHMAVVKTRISDRENPAIDSICSIYPGAEFHEREVYDLLGIKFNDHPDLRRLFLDSTWGYPLRKDYKDDVNIVLK
ncbi:MAG: NADH-quinone oxidoreductase subunit C [Bacteroidales bacterium]|nr:NADH-quinone oxidoreductase subunit C [Bacteroidales bacterium]